MGPAGAPGTRADLVPRPPGLTRLTRLNPDAASGRALRALAQEQGLTWADEARTPLSGSDASSYSVAGGRLPGGTQGIVLDLCKKVTPKNEGDPTEEHATVLLTRIPESASFLPALTARDPSKRGLGERLLGPGGLIPFYEHIEFESIKLNKTYRVGVFRRQDMNWVRQLFAPTFIDYLAERAPDGCYFDLFGGVLRVASSEPVADLEELTRFCEFGSHVADRIRSEALENEGVPGTAKLALDERVDEYQRDLDEKVGRVSFDSPPADVKSAARRYRRVASGQKLGWIISWAIAAVVSVIPAVFVGGLAGAATDSVAIAGIGFAAVGVPLFFWLFAKLAAGQVSYQATTLGLEAFLRGYAPPRGLKFGSSGAFVFEHMRLTFAGRILRVLEGRLPGAGMDGDLVICLVQGNHQPFGVGLAAVTTRPDPSPPVQVYPRGGAGQPLVVGGVLIADAKGLVEPESAIAARERLRQDLGDEFTSRYQVLADPSAGPEVGAAISPGVREALLASPGFALSLNGTDVLVQAQPAPAGELTAEAIDSFCAAAGGVAREAGARPLVEA